MEAGTLGMAGFSRALSTSRKLETLALSVSDDEASDRRPHYHAHTFVKHYMTSCATLRCVAITSSFFPCWRSRGTPQHISFNRAPGTEPNAEISGFEALVESA